MGQSPAEQAEVDL